MCIRCKRRTVRYPGDSAGKARISTRGLCNACVCKARRNGEFKVDTLRPPTPVWMADTPCKKDPDSFFPEKGDNPTYARRICAGCKYKAPCLTWAVTYDEPYGVWGDCPRRSVGG